MNRSPPSTVRSLLVYEFVTGGGWWSVSSNLPPASLIREGQLMRDGLVSDLLQIADLEVSLPIDSRLPASPLPACQLPIEDGSAEKETLERLAPAVDGVIVIAPEFDGCLFQRSLWVEEAGGRLFSPDSKWIQLTSDKWQLNRWLSKQDVPVPDAAWTTDCPRDLPFPVVLKPRDGAGSQDIRLLESPSDWPPGELPRYVESFCAGTAASVSVLAGPRGTAICPAGTQRLSRDGTFCYHGGVFPLPAPLANRAEFLAQKTCRALPPTRGYFGIDLVLGADAGGAEDYVIEVNPRLTSSYAALRRLCRGNLAAAMLDLIDGNDVEIAWDSERVEFALS